MNTSFSEFMFEWGPIIIATICLICGFCYGWIYAVGIQQQKTISYIVVLFVILACVMAAVLSENVRGEKMLRGQFVQRSPLGIPIPLLAGIGLFAWCNPEKWISVAESRKYMRELKEK
jgi:hypothetical protein